MPKSERAQKLVKKHNAAMLPVMESILTRPKTTARPSGHLGLSLDYDSCVDVLQTKNGLEVPNPFEPRGGYVSGTGVKPLRLAVAHYFMRALLETMAARHTSVTLFNSSYNQSSRRTTEFSQIARVYRWRFNSMRNTTEVKGESHAGFKRRTFTAHATKFPNITRFVFADDLKTNVNSVARAKVKQRVTAIHFDYSRYVTGQESLSKFTERALTGAGALAPPGRFRTWVKKLSAI